MNNNTVGEFIPNQDAIDKVEKGVLGALVKTAQFIRTDAVARQVIPFDYGNLQRDVGYDFDEKGNAAYIIHNRPYAIYVYNGDGMHFQTVNNINAQSHWYKAYEGQGERVETVNRFYADQVKQLSEGIVK